MCAGVARVTRRWKSAERDSRPRSQVSKAAGRRRVSVCEGFSVHKKDVKCVREGVGDSRMAGTSVLNGKGEGSVRNAGPAAVQT